MAPQGPNHSRRSTNESDRDFSGFLRGGGATVNSRVRVTLETGEVVTGVIVEDFGELIPTGGSVEATIDDERGAARLRRFLINTDRGVVFGDPDTVEVIG
ncbi:MAG: hypothetical protein KDB67_05330 [Gordonia sp.]|nr:hypothetical protein [Gordonia sp. (in: high G+C Gram-positive bacteria)]HQV19223.1 hypothetical protein [Gordonia sp. (in: high G+C Gram-positive bacteria)]